eukprot:6488643-Pyramimonas_sp.AAC.1
MLRRWRQGGGSPRRVLHERSTWKVTAERSATRPRIGAQIGGVRDSGELFAKLFEHARQWPQHPNQPHP